MRGAEIGSEVEPFGNHVDDDNSAAPAVDPGRGIDAQSARALNHDTVAKPNVPKCEQHLGQGAIKRRDGFVGKVLGDFVQRLSPAGVVNSPYASTKLELLDEFLSPA